VDSIGTQPHETNMIINRNAPTLPQHEERLHLHTIIKEVVPVDGYQY
jgi:hypothetical protein